MTIKVGAQPPSQPSLVLLKHNDTCLGVDPPLPLVAAPVMAPGLVPRLLLQRLLGAVFACVYVRWFEEGGQWSGRFAVYETHTHARNLPFVAGGEGANGTEQAVGRGG